MPTKEQRQLMKVMDKLFKQKYAFVAKQYGFKSSSYNAFKVDHSFFFDCFVTLNNLALFDNYLEITISLHVKPLQVDEIYWEIFGLDENKKKPLSFRAQGVFVVKGPTLLIRHNITLKESIPNEENLTKIIKKGFDLIAEKINAFLKQWTVETFDSTKFEYVGISNDQVLLEMLLLIMNGKYKETLDFINIKLNQNEKGQYYKSDGTNIYDLVKKYCEKKV